MTKKQNYPVLSLQLAFLISPAFLVLIFSLVDFLFFSHSKEKIMEYLPTALIIGAAGFGYPSVIIASVIIRNNFYFNTRNLLKIALYGAIIYFVTAIFWVLFSIILNLDLLKHLLPIIEIALVTLIIALLGGIISTILSLLFLPREKEK